MVVVVVMMITTFMPFVDAALSVLLAVEAFQVDAAGVCRYPTTLTTTEEQCLHITVAVTTEGVKFQPMLIELMAPSARADADPPDPCTGVEVA
jgi:hypothetical protein